MITIGFEYSNEYGEKYESKSHTEVFEDESELMRIGEQLNAFLRQMTYVRKNDLIFMDDINEEEYEAIAKFLKDYRADKKEAV